MNTRHVGLLIAASGAVLVLLGLLIALGWLTWFGRLPGDVRIEREGVRIYIPIVSMLLVSAALSALAYLLRRLS